MKNFESKKELLVNKALVQSNVHTFLIESEEYGVNCLDLEEEITKSLIQWINANQIKLKEDYKSFYPKTLPLMGDLENLLKNKLDKDRVNIEGSDKNFRINKIVGNWASKIYDSILTQLFLVKK